MWRLVCLRPGSCERRCNRTTVWLQANHCSTNVEYRRKSVQHNNFNPQTAATPHSPSRTLRHVGEHLLLRHDMSRILLCHSSKHRFIPGVSCRRPGRILMMRVRCMSITSARTSRVSAFCALCPRLAEAIERPVHNFRVWTDKLCFSALSPRGTKASLPLQPRRVWPVNFALSHIGFAWGRHRRCEGRGRRICCFTKTAHKSTQVNSSECTRRSWFRRDSRLTHVSWCANMRCCVRVSV
jgi:hypothetical protein